jgi:transmembrane protein EpsG
MFLIWLGGILSVIILGLIEIYSSYKAKISGVEAKSYKIEKLGSSVVIILLTVISGLRSGIGDTGYYMYSYVNLSLDINSIFELRDWGFLLYQSVLRLLFPHPQALLIVTAFITLLLIVKNLVRFSYSLSFSIFLFLTSGIYLSTMNGMRQYLAASIIFIASIFLFKKDRFKYLLMILLASTLHNSALVMIPVYFIVHRKAWSKLNIVIYTILIAIALNFNVFFDTFSTLLSNSQYSFYIGTFGSDYYQGTNILRIIFGSLPLLLSFFYRKRLSENLMYYDIYSNFATLSFIMLLYASNNWLFARLNFYFGLYNLIFIPAIVFICFKPKQRLLVSYITFLTYVTFLYFEMRPHVYTSYFLNINRDLIGTLTNMFYR